MRPFLPALLAMLLLPGCLVASSDDAQDPNSGLPAGAAGPTVPTWPALDEATIRPGVPLEPLASYQAVGSLGPVLGPKCTSNFLFLDANTGTLLLGTAAHCVAMDDGAAVASQTYCDKASLPLGTAVHVQGATRPGTLAYSAALAMQELGEQDAGACAGNDFALVALDPADYPAAHPAVLFIGGPTANTSVDPVVDQALVTYGSSADRPRHPALDVAEGKVTGLRNEGWTALATFSPPRIPGDSGSAVLTDSGLPFGVISTLNGSGNNGVVVLDRALTYAREATGMDLQVMTWDQL